MTSVLLIAYGVYLTLVGIKGNAKPLVALISSEHQFLYWLIVMIVITALWESPVAEPFAQGFAILIVLGFLLHNSNYKKIGAGLTDALKAPTPSGQQSATTPPTQSITSWLPQLPIIGPLVDQTSTWLQPYLPSKGLFGN